MRLLGWREARGSRGRGRYATRDQGGNEDPLDQRAGSAGALASIPSAAARSDGRTLRRVMPSPRPGTWNLAARLVSGRGVPRLPTHIALARILAALAFATLAFTPRADAQRAPPETGYELALNGPTTVRGDREVRLRGIAYRVRGLSTLEAYAGRVRARFRTETREGRWLEIASAADGRFELRVPIGSRSPSSDQDEPRIEVEVGPEESARTFSFPVTVVAPWELTLHTDRNLYEPGEPVHLWMLVRDTASGRPAVDRSVSFELDGPATGHRTERVTTTAAGVAHVTFTLGESAPAGSVSVTARVDGGTQSASFRIGRRTWERLFAHVDIEPEQVAPGAAATVVVHVTSADATPIRDATVDVTVSGSSVRGVTSATGEARIEVHAPAFLDGETGFASVEVHVQHAAYGSVDVARSMRLAVPLTLSLDIVPAHAALVPEVDDVVFVRLEDVLHAPPPAGTTVELTGPAIPSGHATETTDENGIAAFRVRLPRGASAGAEDEQHTTIRAHVSGTALELTSRVTVPVQLTPEVVPTLAHPLAEPAGRIEVRLARRPSAQRATVVVELLALGSEELLDLVFAPPSSTSVTLTVPPDRLGRLHVRARAVLASESLESVGASDTLLVRPGTPDFVSLTPVRQRWRVGETAQVDLHSLPGGPRAWGALLVRDLAAHGGESDFDMYFLRRAFERALLEPRGEAGERFLRAALAAAAPIDVAQPTAAPVVDALGLPDLSRTGEAESNERFVLRDPWPLARELERRGLVDAMSQIESALTEALDQGSLDEITVGRGSARRFRDDLLADGGEYVTLGEGALTPAMLEAVDPSFSYENVARRIARVRLIRLLSSLASYLDPGDDASVAARTASREPFARWLPRMVERGLMTDEALDDPWGGRFALHASAHPSIVLSVHATTLELVSPGPDSRLGTVDDVHDPFARVVPAGTPYAVGSGEDALMRQLAILSPVERTLDALREAYGRISAEMTEDEIGDAVHASVSEGTIGLGNIGTIGHGAGGGGTGSGYGSGRGGFSGRSSAVPTVRAGGGNLARVVRERFPPTIVFRPAFEVPLADAVTSYRIEVIVWREDGWVWSARTEISSDRDIVIDAPIPTVAHLGDRLAIPLRVQNHGDADRDVLVSLLGDAAIGIDDVEPQRVSVPAGGASAVVVSLAPGARGDGSLRVVVTDLAGAPLDAVRRPLRVVLPERRVRVTSEVLVDGRGELALEIDDAGDPISGSASVVAGSGLFDAQAESTWSAWSSPGDARIEAVQRQLGEGAAAALGFALGAAYVRAGIPDERLRHAEEQLSSALDARGSGTASLETNAWTLLGLAPAARALGVRPDLSEDTGLLIARLVRDVGDGAAGLDDDTALGALSAAALGWSGDERSRPRVAELVRRLAPSVVEVGENVWLATVERPIRSTLLLAMAELALGHRPRAFTLLATVARFRALGHGLSAEETGLARAIADRLAEGVAPTTVRLVLDGSATTVDLETGMGLADLVALATPGSHRLLVETDGTAPVRVTSIALFGVPWEQAPERAGPFTMTLSGEPGARDDVSQLELRVVNRSPRWITAPIVELELPTGAELAEDQHALIRRVVRRSDLEGARLTMALRALAPGAEVRIPLPVRWSVAGTLAGIGAAAHAADAPDAISLLRPEPLVIEGDAP